MSNPTPPACTQQPHPEPPLDPFGGGPENWSLPSDAPWPPVDEAELAALDLWMDAREREALGRDGGE